MWKKLLMLYNNSRFRKKLLFIYVLTSILPLFMILLISSRLNTKNMTDKVDQLMVENLTQIAERVNLNLEVYTNTLYQMYQDEQITDNIKVLMDEESTGKAVAYHKINNRLKQYNTLETGVRCISVICADESAVIYDFATSSLVDHLWSGEESLLTIQPFLDAVEEPGMVITPTMTFDDKGKKSHYFHISKRIFNLDDLEQGSIATLVMSIDANVLNRICNMPASEELERSINFIMHEDDTVISFPDEDFSGIRKNPKLTVGEFVDLSGFLKNKNTAINTYQDPVTGWIFYNIYDRDYMLGDVREAQLLYLLIGGVAVIGSTVLILYLVKQIDSSVGQVVAGIKEVGAGNLNAIVPLTQKDEIGEIADNFNRMTIQVRELVTKVKEATDKQKNAEIRALEAQINPHFLYNTLDSINWMAIEHEEYEISKMLRNLGIILRYSVNKSNTIVTIKEVTEWLEHYVCLHQMRFDGSFDYHFYVDEQAMGLYIHKLLLQPFIENAILHGFKEIEAGGLLNVDIMAAEDRSMLHIIIEDNGKGMPQEKVEQFNDPDRAIMDDGRSIGLHNAFSRMRIYYGMQASWNVKSIEGMGTVVTLKLPAITRKEQEGV